MHFKILVVFVFNLTYILTYINAKILLVKITLFWSYFEENLEPVKVRLKDII